MSSMAEEEFLRLLAKAREEDRRASLPPVTADDESLYELHARHAESGAAAH
ncbi:hypothetical protein [Streptomyces sp. NPDC059491]|uniref:hypothetical protein n=1 Tax=unclassified Streptomyces TaxID=2593676 RepID=UPI0036B97625